MKIAVCGGRDYVDRDIVYLVLNALHSQHPITLLLHGGATGADEFAEKWARTRNVDQKIYRAAWRDIDAPGAVVVEGRYGPYNKLAGFQRNQQIIDENPDIKMLVAFPGGAGTADMIKRARKAGVYVFAINGAEPTRPSVHTTVKEHLGNVFRRAIEVQGRLRPDSGGRRTSEEGAH